MLISSSPSRPDNCDGSYESYCDPSREFSNITAILESHEATDVLDYISEFWKDYQGDDEDFWSHEWNKHGTCMSTLEVECYTDYKPQEEVKDYFAKAVEIHKGLNTYQVSAQWAFSSGISDRYMHGHGLITRSCWQTLADAGIVPDESKTYTLSEIQAAISEKHGLEITLNCRDGKLNEAWYFYNIKGSAQTGEYVPAEPGEYSALPIIP